MNKINGITNQGAQTIGLTIADGSRATLSLYYRPQQGGWFFDLVWPGSSTIPIPFSVYGRRLVVSPNVLRQFRDLIPFGLLVVSRDGNDPVTQDGFAVGDVELVLLNAADVAALEGSIFLAT